MKRELLDNVKVIPGAAGKVIDRGGFLSAVLAVSVGEFEGEPDGAVLSLLMEHADTADGEFLPVADTMVNPEQMVPAGGIPDREIADGEELSLNLDLVGCKRYIRITPGIAFTGGTSPDAADAAYALVLGDPNVSPA